MANQKNIKKTVTESKAIIDDVEKVIEEEVKPTESKMDIDLLVDVVHKIAGLMCGFAFHPYEVDLSKRIIRSVIANDGDEVTAIFPRQSGKSHTIAATIEGLMVCLPKFANIFPEELGEFKRGFHVGIFAPNGEQAQTIFMRLLSFFDNEEAEKVLQDPDFNDDWETRNGYLQTASKSYAYAQSGAPRSKIESKTYHMVVIDEAQDMDERVILKSIHPMVASKNGSIIKIGSCKDSKCEFLDVISRNKRKDLRLPKKLKTHHETTWREVEKANPKYGKFVKKEIERYGEDSDYFRMNYNNEWILETGMFCSERTFNLCTTSAFSLRQEERTPVVAGIDFGKKRDRMILTILKPLWNNPTPEGYYHKIILNWLEIKNGNYNDQFYRIVEFLKSYNVSNIVLDSTGVGEPMFDRIKEYYGATVNVTDFVFSMPSKSALYKFLKQEMESGRLIIPGDTLARRSKKWIRFRQELLDMEKGYKGPYMTVGHPDSRDAHDDYPDSLALAMWATQRFEMPMISEVSAQHFNSGGHGVPNELFVGNGTI